MNFDGTGEQSGLDASLGHLKGLFQSQTMFFISRRLPLLSQTYDTTYFEDGSLPLDLIIAILQEIKGMAMLLH